jgi:hypothetical protein
MSADIKVLLLDNLKVNKIKAKPEKTNLDNSKAKVGKKDSQLLIRINGADRDEFIALCEALDTSAAREIRRFIRTFIQENQAG